LLGPSPPWTTISSSESESENEFFRDRCFSVRGSISRDSEDDIAGYKQRNAAVASLAGVGTALCGTLMIDATDDGDWLKGFGNLAY